MKKTTLITIALATGLAASAQAVTVITDFESQNSDFTDGYGTGSGTPFSISGPGDTADGWTWYTEDSATNTISIPFAGAGGGTVTLGEQVIRIANNMELRTNEFTLGWGVTNTVALRSQSFNVAAGDANVDWTLGSSNTGAAPNLNTYYSQDGGSSWTGVAKGDNFTVASGTMQILLARNNGLDHDPSLDTLTVSYVPEPSSAFLLGLGGLALILRRRKSTPFHTPPLRSKGGFKALPPKANS